MKLYATATVALFLLVTIQTTPAAAEEQDETNAESKAEAITEPAIKLVHVLNPGEREYLSPNLIGVQNIAMTYLPLSMNFVNIIDAYREIVNGVRYEILLNAVDTKSKDADTICRLVILEQPWITTQWGDKHRELINSNCSDVNDNALPIDSEQRSKALNDKYVSNNIFNGGKRNELTDSEMAHLESQILTSLPSGISSSISTSNKRYGPTTTTTTIRPSTTVRSPPLTESTNEPATSISVNEAAATLSATDTAPATGQAIDAADSAPVSTTAEESSSSSSITSTTTAELNDNEQRWLDDFLSVGAYNFEKTIEQQRLELKQQQQQQVEQQPQQQEQQAVEQQTEEQQVEEQQQEASLS